MRGGFGGFTQQHAIFTIVKGGVGGRNGLVTLSLNADRSALPDVPEHAAGLPAGRGRCPRAASRRSRPTSRTSTRGRRVSVSSISLGARTSVAVDFNINRGTKQGFST